jgi:hypothetical protein
MTARKCGAPSPNTRDRPGTRGVNDPDLNLAERRLESPACNVRDTKLSQQLLFIYRSHCTYRSENWIRTSYPQQRSQGRSAHGDAIGQKCEEESPSKACGDHIGNPIEAVC